MTAAAAARGGGADPGHRGPQTAWIRPLSDQRRVSQSYLSLREGVGMKIFIMQQLLPQAFLINLREVIS